MTNGTTHYADDDTLKYIGELKDALTRAIPYVEEAIAWADTRGFVESASLARDICNECRAALAKSE